MSITRNYLFNLAKVLTSFITFVRKLTALIIYKSKLNKLFIYFSLTVLHFGLKESYVRMYNIHICINDNSVTNPAQLLCHLSQ